MQSACKNSGLKVMFGERKKFNTPECKIMKLVFLLDELKIKIDLV